MVHTLATQTRILSLTIVILQLRHNIATVGFGRPKLGHKDAPILKDIIIAPTLMLVESQS